MRFLKIFFALTLTGCLLYTAAYLYSTNQSTQVDASLSAAVQAKREQRLTPSPDILKGTPVCSISPEVTRLPKISYSPSVGSKSSSGSSKKSNSDHQSLLESTSPASSFSPEPTHSSVFNPPVTTVLPIVKETTVPTTFPTPTVTPKPHVSASPTPSSLPNSDSDILPEYQMLLEQNDATVGWISVKDTPIDYPVMFTPEDPEFYLHRNFEKISAFSGTPFLDGRCDPDVPSSNLIIYGHNMRNGSMFGTLKHYEEEEYFLQHPYILFDTLRVRGQYQVFAVIPIKLEELTHERMRCYSTNLTEDQLQIDALRAYVLEYASQYRLDALPEVGGQVITLSTCTGFRRSNRLVVMAAKIGVSSENTVSR